MPTDHRKSENRRRLAPPPDYFSRGMQWRLLAVVTVVMLLLVVAFEGPNQGRWKWLKWFGEPAEPQQDDFNTRLPTNQTAGANSAVDIDSPSPAMTSFAGDGDLSASDRAWADGWQEVFAKLAYPDRALLYELLKGAEDGTSLAADMQPDAEAMLTSLSEHWSEFLATASNSLQQLDRGDREAWGNILDQANKRWSKETEPLLRASVEGRVLSERERSELANLQNLLDQQQLAAVTDDTLWRPSEREIWFRLFGKLQKITSHEAESLAAEPVSYAQLFEQPDVYRGRQVTVRGTAEAVYSVEAPRNTYSIDRYWVYWLRPEGGPNSPLVVYALEKPEGLPAIDLADVGKEKMASVVDVEFAGIFFKRMAYRGQGGVFTAPLLLARSPQWTSASPRVDGELPSVLAMLGTGLVLAALAALLAAWVGYRHPLGRRALAARLPERIAIGRADG